MVDSIKQQLEKKIRHKIEISKAYLCPISYCQATENIKLDMIAHVLDKHTVKEILEIE